VRPYSFIFSIVALFFVPTPAVAADSVSFAVFPFEFLDTSGEAPGPDRDARLKLATDTLADALAKTGRYTMVGLDPYKAEIAAMEPRYKCGDCFLGVAGKAGAKYAAVSVVHKISTLISAMNIVVFDVSSGALIADASGQIRGDTDEAYRHGVAFIVRNRLLDELADKLAK
jgi:hypothetical protein